MRNALSTVSGLYRRWIVFMPMIFASAFCLFMLLVRMAYTRNTEFSFMVWNLALAWLPPISAFVAYKFHQKEQKLLQVLSTLSMGIWLVFLPNSPYLLTELVHLSPRTDMSFWFDLTMLMSFAVTGLLFGLVSLYWMQNVVAKWVGTFGSRVFVISVSALCSFGIYLGRFQRWNSWDVLTNPAGLITNIWEIFRHPITNYQIFAFSGLLLYC